MSAVEASSTFARTASLSSIMAAASSSSFWFFTSCYLFVVLFSFWRGFAGVLWCRRVLSFSYFTCFHLYSMMVSSLTAGSEYP